MTCTEGGLSITQGGNTRIVEGNVATLGVLTCGTGGSNKVHSMSATTGDSRFQIMDLRFLAFFHFFTPHMLILTFP